MKDKTETIGAILLIVFVLYCGIWIAMNPIIETCTKYKTVVSIETSEISNIWGKEVVFIETYDDGSKEQNSMSYSNGIGYKQCFNYEWNVEQ